MGTGLGSSSLLGYSGTGFSGSTLGASAYSPSTLQTPSSHYLMTTPRPGSTSPSPREYYPTPTPDTRRHKAATLTQWYGLSAAMIPRATLAGNPFHKLQPCQEVQGEQSDREQREPVPRVIVLRGGLRLIRTYHMSRTVRRPTTPCTDLAFGNNTTILDKARPDMMMNEDGRIRRIVATAVSETSGRMIDETLTYHDCVENDALIHIVIIGVSTHFARPSDTAYCAAHQKHTEIIFTKTTGYLKLRILRRKTIMQLTKASDESKINVENNTFTDSRIDTQDRGYRPNFPGLLFLSGEEIKHREVRFGAHGFEAGKYPRSGSLDTLNEGEVFRASSVDNLVGVLQKRSDVGPTEYLEVHASNTGEARGLGVDIARYSFSEESSLSTFIQVAAFLVPESSSARERRSNFASGIPVKAER
ncbi:hypothetical protein T265_10570 [Opisthorchis viverrini]|uniref:Uncharacterized protein n=1 Tax=Opisthorchis viverrini TaxID=6198 RepID=A0A075A0T3_OPIVI|nr:hypothetical protein T265_10570 [Opisthorchis viverrini]KER21019.1 hypothetical protein T265_10570 [Opisthorchis viverrini]